MSLEIIITKNESKSYWEDEEAEYFVDINPNEWECLFFKEFNVLNYLEYTAEKRDPKTYRAYYLVQISLLKAKFPLILRIKDYYEDAFFSKSEINGLIQEILSLKPVVKRKESRRFLDQLQLASEKALKNNAGMKLVAD